ncbi:hypothetical protein EB796_019769 [Bugula neritina]|uniref:Uncharacterized protein n=1 Tax=Bugula neritina TaxID=10212 RepID=A0A7J7J6Z1_BUGNE|nr:hypothetical protein EB796_019769 [Bugula neritina]
MQAEHFCCDRLQSAIVTISKHTATTSYVIDIPNSVKSTATWDSIAVGSCDRKEADSCIYLAKISAVDRQLEILRFEEPEFNNGSSGTITVENIEKISIKLSSHDDTAYSPIHAG